MDQQFPLWVDASPDRSARGTGAIFSSQLNVTKKKKIPSTEPPCFVPEERVPLPLVGKYSSGLHILKQFVGDETMIHYKSTPKQENDYLNDTCGLNVRLRSMSNLVKDQKIDSQYYTTSQADRLCMCLPVNSDLHQDYLCGLTGPVPSPDCILYLTSGAIFKFSHSLTSPRIFILQQGCRFNSPLGYILMTGVFCLVISHGFKDVRSRSS